MKELDYSRDEISFSIDKGFDLTALRDGYEMHEHPTSYVTTIYFGATSEKWDGVKPLSDLGLSLKARFYNDTRHSSLFLVREADTCSIELKTTEDGIRGKIKKYKAHEEEGERPTYGELLKYVTSLFGVSKTSGRAFEAIGSKLTDLINEHAITTLKPVGASHYVRKHFVGDGHRVTVDSDVTYYVAVTHDKDVIFSQSEKSDTDILEIKKGRSLDLKALPIVSILENAHISYGKLEKTKGAKIAELARIQHGFIEPELDERADNDWVITEREIKLDALEDPRMIGSTVPLGDNIEVFSGEPIVNMNYQKVYNVGPSGIVYMAMSPEGDDPMLKYKIFMGNDELGALVRRETVLPYSPQALTSVMHELDPLVDPEKVSVSPMFHRNRFKGNIYMAKTRNVFEIYSDHSTFLDEGYEPFNQVEIEYAGIVGPLHITDFDQDELVSKINEDFTTLRRIVLDVYKENKNELTPSIRSKYDWVNKEVFQRNEPSKV